MTDTSVTAVTDPAPASEPEQDWYFTFGHGQRGYSLPTYGGHHPDEHGAKGFRLDDRYVVIHGTHTAARARMVDMFGPVWSMEYASAEKAGVEKYGLTQLVITPEYGDTDLDDGEDES